MKKLLLVIALLIGHLTTTIAQDTIVLNAIDIPYGTVMNHCINTVVIVYAEPNCNQWYWTIDEIVHGDLENPIIIESQVSHVFRIHYYGCTGDTYFRIGIYNTDITTSFVNTIWKRYHEPIVLEPVGTDSLSWFNYIWSTGQTSATIEVAEPGTYSCEVSDLCGSATRTFIVRDNVEMSLATCDLETNHNMVTWPTTPEQAEYISTVKVKRDGMDVGTAPYTDGYFTDNIGSDAASRTYTVVGITPEGEECPITSYPKETIHMAYLTGINNTIEVNWNIPTGYDLLGYNICEWNPSRPIGGAGEHSETEGVIKDGDLTVIDFVGAGVTSYTCSENQFDNGMVVVQGVENGRPESRLLSNRSWETVGIGEHTKQNFKIFPNPTNGSFTVEGTPTVTVYNILGQTVTTNHSENGTHTFTLRPGIYTVRNSDGLVRKVVVE